MKVNCAAKRPIVWQIVWQSILNFNFFFGGGGGGNGGIMELMEPKPIVELPTF